MFFVMIYVCSFFPAITKVRKGKSYLKEQKKVFLTEIDHKNMQQQQQL